MAVAGVATAVIMFVNALMGAEVFDFFAELGPTLTNGESHRAHTKPARHRSQKCMHDRPGRDRTRGCLKGESGSEPSSQCGMEKTYYLMRDHRRSERQDGDGGARF